MDALDFCHNEPSKFLIVIAVMAIDLILGKTKKVQSNSLVELLYVSIVICFLFVINKLKTKE